ncbi:MAG: aldehyde dehydrogenase family protein, partial [Elusimicrobia bacterium]|nr:aldehyde dehydrogenase family protein [Elusimicrobiota bacterium]
MQIKKPLLSKFKNLSKAQILKWTEYGPAPESIGHVQLKERYDLFIAGKWTPAASGQTFETVNPATGKVLARVAKAGQEDVERAVKAARTAFSAWSRRPGAERARYLFAIARVLQERSREFAIVETLDNGKPIRETRDLDIPLAARHFFYHAGWADKLEEAFPGLNVSPVGVVGQIIPWNFPLLMAAWKIAPALAAGNTVVLKPAETTPLSALVLAQIFQEVGLPSGVVNIITGFGDAGAMLVRHPDVNKIAFTGSTEVGKMIRRETAGTGKKISLELGGKSPTIVFEDAPLYEAVEGIVDGIFFNQGQVCCAGSRLLVQENIASRFIKLLKERMRKIRVGDPLDKNMDMGAINSKMQLEKIRKYVALGEKEGAVKYQTPCVCPREGYFFPPTLFTEVEPSHVIAREEIFGPVLAVMTFRTKEEAVELANNTPYGLAASVWTKDVGKMVEVSRALRCGTVWGNGTNKFDAAAEFGGYKESGFGREGGPQGLWEYVKVQGSGDGGQGIESQGSGVRGQGLEIKNLTEPSTLNPQPFSMPPHPS